MQMQTLALLAQLPSNAASAASSFEDKLRSESSGTDCFETIDLNLLISESCPKLERVLTALARSLADLIGSDQMCSTRGWIQ